MALALRRRPLTESQDPHLFPDQSSIPHPGGLQSVHMGKVLTFSMEQQKLSSLVYHLLHHHSYKMPNHELSDDGVGAARKVTTSGCFPEYLMETSALQETLLLGAWYLG